MIKSISVLLTVLLCCWVTAAFAQTLYVTDRILLGVHQQASDTSTVITTIPSGTAVTVLQQNNNFSQIQLADGTQGWVSSSYLKPNKPATAQLDAVNAQLKASQASASSLQTELNQRDKQIQVNQDEISNQKSTISELQKKLKSQQASMPSPPKQAEAQIKSLQAQVKQLKGEKQSLVKQSNSTSSLSLRDLQKQNQQLQVRIAAALANLQGQKVPTASQLASIQPSFPLWYWILLFAIFVVGIAAGFGWFDYHHRKRHGGFRI